MAPDQVRGLVQPDQVSLRVGEHREGDHLHLGHWYDGLAPGALDLVQHGLRIRDADVERRMARPALRLPDAAADTSILGHAVVHLG
jgi:hypothetical protein